ncbi:MAG: AAC(3) family N-acetyltransferase [Paracoccaceae bacterium]
MIEDISRDIRKLGVKPGHVIMVHASLKKIGKVKDGAQGVLSAIEVVIGANGTIMMVLGAANDRAWVNDHPADERAALLKGATPFDAAKTPADPEVGYLAEALRLHPKALVSNHPEGRFAALGARAAELLKNPPWDDYFGPGSPLDHLCQMKGGVLRLGADPDTTTLTHFAEYLLPKMGKRRVVRHNLVSGSSGPKVRKTQSLDDSEGIFDYAGEDYFADILQAYLDAGHGTRGKVGNADSHFLETRGFVQFAVQWMTKNL